MSPRVLLTLCLLFTSGVSARAQDQTETVVPIRKVVLPSGGRYFALPLRVGSKRLTAGIDTGSPGLRILSRALDPGDFRSENKPASMTFGSGTTIAGFRAIANVAFGWLGGPVAVEVIERASCVPSRPRCAEGNMLMSEFGLMGGGGVPHQGAPAIIGLTRADIPVTVPFPALGVKRWIPASA